MKTYRIPNTDLDVSSLAYGTWHIGGTWDDTPASPEIYERAERLIHAAVDNGINFIDLADIYVRGKSDMVVGEALKNSPGLREKLVLQQKAGIVLGDDTMPGHYNFSYDHLVGTLETCLGRLNTDRVELLLLHRPDALVEPEEVARAFDHLHSSGKVRYFGVSNHTPMQIELLRRYIDQPIVANQVEVNLLHNYIIRDGVISNTVGAEYAGQRGTLDYCRVNDIQIQAWSPVAGGQLFNPSDDAPANIKAASQVLGELAEKYNVDKGAIALAWLLRHPAGILPILGTMNPERIATSVKADDVELTRIEWYRLFEAVNGASIP